MGVNHIVFHIAMAVLKAKVCVQAGWVGEWLNVCIRKMFFMRPSPVAYLPLCFARVALPPESSCTYVNGEPDSTVQVTACAAAVCCCCCHYHREVLRKLPCTPLTRPCAANPPTEDGCEYDGRPNGLGPLA